MLPASRMGLPATEAGWVSNPRNTDTKSALSRKRIGCVLGSALQACTVKNHWRVGTAAWQVNPPTWIPLQDPAAPLPILLLCLGGRQRTAQGLEPLHSMYFCCTTRGSREGSWFLMSDRPNSGYYIYLESELVDRRDFSLVLAHSWSFFKIKNNFLKIQNETIWNTKFPREICS